MQKPSLGASCSSVSPLFPLGRENRSTAAGIGKEAVNLRVLPITVAAAVAAFEVKPATDTISGKKKRAH